VAGAVEVVTVEDGRKKKGLLWCEESRQWNWLLLWTVAARDKAPGAVTACTARGGVAGGRPRHREVAGDDHATLRSRACVGRDTQLWADVGY
jgi:hypothetical protein